MPDTSILPKPNRSDTDGADYTTLVINGDDDERDDAQRHADWKLF